MSRFLATKLQRTIALALCFLAFHSSQAKATNFGLKVGASIPQWSLAADKAKSEDYTIKNLSDFSICGIVSVPLTDYISLQIEPAYSRQEFTLEYQKAALQSMTNMQFPTSLPNTLSFTHDFVNINCPVLLKLYPTDSGVRPYMLAGVVAGVNLSATATANFDTTSMNLSTPIEVKPEAHAITYGLQAGAGIEIPLFASIRFVADARYSFALSDAASLTAFNTALGSVKASHFLLLAGVELSL